LRDVSTQIVRTRLDARNTISFTRINVSNNRWFLNAENISFSSYIVYDTSPIRIDILWIQTRSYYSSITPSNTPRSELSLAKDNETNFGRIALSIKCLRDRQPLVVAGYTRQHASCSPTLH